MKVNVGIAGFGVVGTGVIKMLRYHYDMLRKRSGVDIRIKKIAVSNIEREREPLTDSNIITDDFYELLNDDDIDVIIELIGGTTAAYELVTQSIKKGKHIVTANKALLYQYAEEIFELAVKHKRHVLFEGSVAGGIPIIKIITESLAGDKIHSIYGIVNGTTNYILTKMIEEKQSFNDALKSAQVMGFAEADPTLDINGGDASSKIGILGMVAFNSKVNRENIYREGIENIELRDIEYADELGYCVKLLAIAKLRNEKMELRVHPALIPKESNLASVKNEFNAVMIESDFLGLSHYVGKGAGASPTASAVVSDINGMSLRIKTKEEYNENRYKPFNEYETINHKEIETRYYLRITTIERAGILAVITKIFAEHNISISSIIQKEVRIDRPVPIVILTQKSIEKNMLNAVKEIDKLDIIKEKTVMIRMEDPEN